MSLRHNHKSRELKRAQIVTEITSRLNPQTQDRWFPLYERIKSQNSQTSVSGESSTAAGRTTTDRSGQGEARIAL